MSNVLGATPKIDTTDFQNGIKHMNAALRALESGFKANAASLGDWSKTATGLEMRSKSLEQQIGVQKQKVDTLREAYEKAKTETGETSTQTLNAATAYNKAAETLGNMEGELTDTNSSLAEMSDESGAAGDSVEELGTSADETGGQLFTLQDALGAVGAVAGIAVTAITAVGAAALAAAGGVAALALNASEYGSQFADLSVKTGISTTRLQELNYASEILGTSLDTITGAQARLIRSMDDAKGGTGDQAEAFKSLGISVTDAGGNLRNADDVFSEALDALGGIENAAERDALAMGIFGKSAQELNPLIKAGSDELARLSAEASTMGAVMSEEGVAAADEFGDKLAGLKLGFQGVVAQIGLVFLPGLSGVADKAGGYLQQLVDIVQGSGGDVGNIAAGIGELLGTVISDLAAQAPELLQIGTTLIESVLDSITAALPVLLPAAASIITSLVNFISSNLGTILQSGIQIILTLIDALIANAPMLIEAALQAVVTLAQSLSEAAPTLIPRVVEMIILIVNTLIENAPLLIDAALQLIIGLAQGIIAALPILIENIPLIVTAIFDALVEAAPMIGAAAITLINTLWRGIIDLLPTIGKAGVELVIAAIKGIESLKDSLREAGENIVIGLWEGMDENIDWLLGNVMGFAQSVIDAVKEALGMQSPSKKGVAVGKNLVESIGLGGMQALPQVNRAFAGMANQMALVAARNSAQTAVGAGEINTDYYAYYAPVTQIVSTRAAQSAEDAALGRRF